MDRDAEDAAGKFQRDIGDVAENPGVFDRISYQLAEHDDGAIYRSIVKVQIPGREHSARHAARLSRGLRVQGDLERQLRRLKIQMPGSTQSIVGSRCFTAG